MYPLSREINKFPPRVQNSSSNSRSTTTTYSTASSVKSESPTSMATTASVTSENNSLNQRPKSRTQTSPLPTTRPSSWNGSSETLQQTSPPRASELPQRRTKTEQPTNLYTQCGRHSKDWLFGGFSVKDTVRKMWEKKKSDSDDH